MRPKASWAGLICRTDQCFQRQRLPYKCGIKTVKAVRWIKIHAELVEAGSPRSARGKVQLPASPRRRRSYTATCRRRGWRWNVAGCWVSCWWARDRFAPPSTSSSGPDERPNQCTCPTRCPRSDDTHNQRNNVHYWVLAVSRFNQAPDFIIYLLRQKAATYAT